MFRARTERLYRDGDAASERSWERGRLAEALWQPGRTCRRSPRCGERGRCFRSHKKGPAAVSSAAWPPAWSPGATAGLLPAVAEVPMHEATLRAMHAAYRVPANVGDIVLGAGDGCGRSRAERGRRGRRREGGGAERGQQSRGDHRCAQGLCPLVPPPETLEISRAEAAADRPQPGVEVAAPNNGSERAITKRSGFATG